MVTEKTARKREAAVLQAVSGKFEKIGDGLDFLKKQSEIREKQSEARQKAIEEQIALNEEINEELIKDLGVIEANIDKNNKKIFNESALSKRTTEEVLRSMFVKCNECGKFISPIQIVCHECGSISPIFPYKFGAEGETIMADIEKSLNNLSESVAKSNKNRIKSIHKDIVGDIKKMYEIISIADSYVQAGTNESKKIAMQKTKEIAEEFIRNAYEKNIEIAIVGNVKAGKSSLINALIGGKMASVDATPETSVLVKYRTTSEKNYIRVAFYSSEQWAQLWNTVNVCSFKEKYSKSKAEEIRRDYLDKEPLYLEFDSKDELSAAVMEWTCSQNPQHFFVSEVEVGYVSDALPNDVVLVDTPGLGDPVEYRSNITKNYIHEADWVLICINCVNFPNDTEAKLINQVLANKGHDANKMLIVGTQKDMLVRDRFEKLKEAFLKDVADAQYEGKRAKADMHIVNVCAYLQTILTSYYNGNDLTEEENDILDTCLKKRCKCSLEDKNQLFEYAGINELVDRLNKLVLSQRRLEIIKKIKQDYTNAVDAIRMYIDNPLAEAEEQIIELQSEANEYYEDIHDLEADIDEKVSELNEIEKLVNSLREKAKNDMNRKENK